MWTGNGICGDFLPVIIQRSRPDVKNPAGGQISGVRVYNANHDLIADTALREGTSVLTHTLHNTDGSVETHETIMHVRAMPDRHVTKETTQVFEKKKPQIKPFVPIVEEPVKPAFSPTEDALPPSVNNK